MKSLVLFGLKLYQIVGPFWRQIAGVTYGCGRVPTCSEYTVWAVENYGVLRGLKMGWARFLSCHPASALLRDPKP